MTTHKTDYLVTGAGAMGMAFTDVVMTESDASVTIIDRQHQPGGHWNMAYPFVRLHQPSSFYGVNSRQLGNNRLDTRGCNKGLYELASKNEILAYYDGLMHDFIDSGRVRYLPMCEHEGNGKITSLVSGTSHSIEAGKVVDATFMNVQVPSMAGPSYEVAEGVTCIPPNKLVESRGQWKNYVIVGAGKTSFDACLFLLEHGVDPDSIHWIKPRESWLWDRARAQAEDLFETSIRPFAIGQITSIAASTSLDDLFTRASTEGLMLRIDEEVKPTMFRCATVTKSEITELRRIRNIIRMGRVQSIEEAQVVLDEGTFSYDPQTLFVDCTADGLARRPAQLVFTGDEITLQAVRTCQQVFSAALIAHMEVSGADEDYKNLICTPVPHPDTDLDYLRNTLADLVNGMAWSQDDSLQGWLKASRLDGFSASSSSTAESDIEFNNDMAQYGPVAAEKLMHYLEEV